MTNPFSKFLPENPFAKYKAEEGNPFEKFRQAVAEAADKVSPPENEPVTPEEVAAELIQNREFLALVEAIIPEKTIKEVKIIEKQPITRVEKIIQQQPVIREIIKEGKSGKDGRGIQDLGINEGGELVVTLTDNTMENLGKIVGKDGEVHVINNTGSGGALGVSVKDDGDAIGHGLTSLNFTGSAITSIIRKGREATINTSSGPSGTVTSVSATGSQGVSASVTNPATTPAIAIGLGAITPTSVAASGTVTGSNLSGTNTGDQTITLTGDVTGTGTGSFAATIANDAVTYAKIQDVSATDKVLGRQTAGVGDVEEIDCTAYGRSLLATSDYFTSRVYTLVVPYPITYNATIVGNIGAGEDDLYLVTLGAFTMPFDGDTLEWQAAGTFAATANNKRLRARFGATLIFDSGALAITTANDWSMTGKLIRTSATTQKSIVTLNTSSGTLPAYADYSAPAEGLESGTIDLKVTGEATADNDIVAEFWKVTWFPGF